MHNRLKLSSVFVCCSLAMSNHVIAQDSVFVGHLADMSGPTAFVGKNYADGVRDSLAYINENGGISGTRLESETIDYAYKVPQAIASYKKWYSRKKMVAMQGWGTADTEALISFVARDKVPVFSASYSGHLTDPTGKTLTLKNQRLITFFMALRTQILAVDLFNGRPKIGKKRGVKVTQNLLTLVPTIHFLMHQKKHVQNTQLN